MTTKDKVARRKLSMLQLAQELNNVSKACAIMGYSRQQFYEIRRSFQTYGADGLIDRPPGARGPHPNRVSAEIETAVLEHAVAHPCHGQLRVEQELRLKGLQVSAGGVRGVWMRHGLLTKHDRLLRLEKATAERRLELSDEQVQLLNEDVLPAYDAAGTRIDTVLSDNGREFCGRPDWHPYELFLQLEGIEHRTTRVKRPQSNGTVERFHRTLLDEHFRVEGRRTWFETVDEMQVALDAYLVVYNEKRPHQGRGMRGRTPARAFLDGRPRTTATKETKTRSSETEQAAA